MAGSQTYGFLTDFGNGAAQRNYATRGLSVVVYVDTTGFGTFRNALGQFTSNQREVAQYYRQTAQAIQSDVVRRTVRAYVRPRVSTGRLKQVLSDPAMITADQFGFTVGDEAFLMQSQAKYWRQIEFGTRGVVPSWIGRMVDRSGVPLFGLWNYSATKWNSSGTGAGFSRYGEGSGQMLHPYSSKVRREMVYGDVRDSISRRMGSRTPRAPFRHKHIQPKNAFAEAWDAAGVDTAVVSRSIDILLNRLA